MMPDQGVTTNLDAVPDCEIHNLVRGREIERLRLRVHLLPLQGISGSSMLNSRASVDAYAASES
jgi:hypothetical protein